MRKVIENLKIPILPSDFLLFQLGNSDECCGNHCTSIYFMLTRDDYLSRKNIGSISGRLQTPTMMLYLQISHFSSISIMIFLFKKVCSWLGINKPLYKKNTFLIFSLFLFM